MAGYTWPTSDVCPCAAGVQPCSAACPAAGGGAVPSLGGFGGGGAGVANDNDRSKDKLLERYKKRTLPQKLIVYRIDELKKNEAVIWFRISDVRTSTIEAAQTVVVRKASVPVPARE